MSEFVARQVRDAAPVRAEQIRVLHNGVDVGRYAPARLRPLRAENRQRLGLRETDVAFLFVAHNLGLKNFALLKRVFGRLAAPLPEAKLVLLGKHRPALRADWFVYAGTTRAPEGVYAAADALVHPTFYDACANVVLEALAAGLPVLSSDRNGSAEIVASGENGYVLPVTGEAGEVCEAWSRTIADLGRDAGLRQRIGVGARALAEAHSLERYVADFEAYLAAVLRSPAAAA